MKLRDLKKLLDDPYHFERHADDEVSIRLSDPSIGPVAMTGVRSAGFGFDWEKGHFILFPEKQIVTLKEKEALWQAATDMIYSLSKERTPKGNPTTLAKRAERIMEIAREYRKKEEST